MRRFKKLALLTGCVVASVWLSASAYQARNFLLISKADEKPVSPYTISYSPFSRSQSSFRKERALQFKADELRERLSFMVFTKERNEAQIALQEVLQKQINRAPFTSAYWRDLVFAQQGSDIADAEYKAMFMTAKALSLWNVDERVLLLNRCVNQHQLLTRISPSLCSDLYENLPMSGNVRRLSSVMGVEYQRLLSFLNDIGLDVSGDRPQ